MRFLFPRFSKALVGFCLMFFMGSVCALPSGFNETRIIDDVYQPTSFKFAPDGKIFVTEKRGVVKVYDGLSDNSGTVIYNIDGQVYTKYDNGMSSVAVHPNFPATPYIYVIYSKSPQGSEYPGEFGARLERLTVNAGLNGVDNVTVLLENWCVASANHATGDLQFGNEGALYVSAGSFATSGQFNSDCSEPWQEGGSLKSQDIRTPNDHLWFNGTIIRLDPVTGNPWGDNALNGGNENDDSIIAYGLRNPYRFFINPINSKVFIADVGWERAEEINVIDNVNSAPKNFGWPCYEGDNRLPYYDDLNVSLCESLYSENSDTKPLFYYGNNPPGAGLSITGITVNTMNTFPGQYANALFYTDYVQRYINVMFADGNGNPDKNNQQQFDNGRPIIQVSMGPDGNLYYIEYNVGENGEQENYAIWQIAASEKYQATISADAIVPPNTPVVFDASKSSTRSGQQNSYAWDLSGNGELTDSASATPSYTFTSPGKYIVSVRVYNQNGDSSIAHHAVHVTNDIPVPVITSPAPDDQWSTGDEITVNGHGAVPSTGQSATSLHWVISLRHCERLDPEACHGHPVTEFADGDPQINNRFIAPDHDYPTHMQVQLTAVGEANGVNWSLPEWQKRRTIFLNNYDQAQQSNFPVYIEFTPQTIDYSATGNNGQNLRFVADNGDILSHHIEVWNPNGVSKIWVRLPQLHANKVNQYIDVYYDNDNAPNTATGAMGGWDRNVARLTIANEETKAALQSSIIMPFYPNTNTVALNSEPQGLEINFFAYKGTTPFSVEAIVGSLATISAPEEQSLGSDLYQFVSWDNGMPRSNDSYIPPAEGATLLSSYSHIGTVNCRWEQVLLRGTNNGWATSPMTLGSGCNWTIDVVFGDAANERFKFDMSGNWSESYTDSDNNGIIDAGTGDIAITEGAGNYRITLNDQDMSYSIVKQPAGNIPPTAVAGNDVTVMPGENFTLSGSNSTDSDGSISNYQWSTGETTQAITRSYADEGVYTITLTVTDNEGVTANDSVTVTVSASQQFTSQYPSMSITGSHNGWTPGNDSMSLVGNNLWQIQISLAATDEFKFTPYSNWSVSFGLNGGNANIPVPEGAQLYRVQFNDQTQATSIQVAGPQPNQAPSVAISQPSQGAVLSTEDSIVLQGQASDPEEGSLSASIQWFDTSNNAVGTGASVTLGMLEEGSYSYSASITDSEGLSDLVEVTFSVSEPGTSFQSVYPTMSMPGMHDSWQPGTTSMTLVADYTWQATVALAANSEFKFTPYNNWSENFGVNGGNGNFIVTSGAGEYIVTFNDQTKQGSMTLSGSPSNQAPSIAISQPGNNASLVAGESTSLVATANDPEDGNLTANISWSSSLDGLLGQGSNVIFQLSEGSHTLTASVSDTEGLTTSAQVNVTVTTENTSFNSVYPTMSLTGTHNGWAPGDTPMALVSDFLWQIDIELGANSEYKFTPHNNWSVSFGASGGNGNYQLNSAGHYRITFNDQTNQTSVSLINEQAEEGWSQNGDVYTLVFNGVTFSVDASKGGRIVSYAKDGNEMLYTAGDLSGSTFWTSPQQDWDWPPVTAHDNGPYVSSLANNRLTLTSAPANGIEIRKEIEANETQNSISVNYIMKNISGNPISVAPWEVTRVTTNGVNVFPKGSGYTGQSTLAPSSENDFVWYQHGGQNGQKLFRDGSESWIAHASNGLLFIKNYTTDIAVSQFAPNEAEIEVYAATNYVELEQQGEYSQLMPGTEKSWQVNWELIDIPNGVSIEVNSAGLVDFIRSQL